MTLRKRLNAPAALLRKLQWCVLHMHGAAVMSIHPSICVFAGARVRA